MDPREDPLVSLPAEPSAAFRACYVERRLIFLLIKRNLFIHLDPAGRRGGRVFPPLCEIKGAKPSAGGGREAGSEEN